MAVRRDFHSVIVAGNSMRNFVPKCIFPSRPASILYRFSPDPLQDRAGIECCI